jgi:hypothetical protein
MRAGDNQKNLTVRTVRNHIICYQLWPNSKVHIKTIIGKGIYIVKTMT